MADSQETQQRRSIAYNLRPSASKIKRQVTEAKPVIKPRITKQNQKPKTNVHKGCRIMVPQDPKTRENNALPNPEQQQSNSDMEIFCSICLDTENYIKSHRLFCGHVFHSKCINEWLSFKFSCPICRGPTDDLSTRHLSRFREFSINLTRWLIQSGRFTGRIRS
ncbi:hypothetical protein NPIL_633371 [Nephila pilipes]|uniref:RING-type domain-containing protein n=1 Tax=Nephila pilipes TaxID=299642 RepID=A0A8X6MMR7_NEPPI|nr:hypothetical protein NPIL_633371 [Nephila pilipes]